MKAPIFRTRKLTITGMLIAITAILVFTPIGFISLGTISLTTVHIPVLIGTLAEGPVTGFILALFFGISSVLKALFQAKTPLDPFFADPVVSIPSRILIPFATLGVYFLLNRFMPKNRHIQRVNWAVSAAIGSLVNTVATLLMLYIRHNDEINNVITKLIEEGDLPSAFSQKADLVLISVVGIPNGISEMVISILLVPAILSAIREIYGRNINRKTKAGSRL